MPGTENLKIEYVAVDSLTPYEKNARSHGKEDLKAIEDSIKEFGFVDPIGVWHDIIVEGHGRLLAAKQIGMTEVPVIHLDQLTDEQRRAYDLAHNKTAELSGWDFNVLASELQDIAEIDMSKFGFDMSALGEDEGQQAEEIEEDEAPDEVEKRASAGDVWKLGGHRLFCGDSTDPKSYEKLMDGAVADLVFTDPPYGMKKENEGVLNDNLNFDDLLEFNKKWIPESFKNLKTVGSWYCWGMDEPLMDIYSEILKPMKKLHGENKLQFRNLITWDKGRGMGQLSEAFRSYAIADEKCLFVMRGRQTYGETKEDYWDGFEPIRQKILGMIEKLRISKKEVEKFAETTTVTHWWATSQWEFPNVERWKLLTDNLLRAERINREEYDRIREEYDRIREEYDRIREEWYKTRAYFDNTHDNMNDVWHFDRTSQKEREDTGGHATPKPIALCARAIKSSSREGEIVLDCFGGSGSTLIACEQTKRRCYMIELDPHYCDVIIQRWENFTGGKAEKLNDDEDKMEEQDQKSV